MREQRGYDIEGGRGVGGSGIFVYPRISCRVGDSLTNHSFPSLSLLLAGILLQSPYHPHSPSRSLRPLVLESIVGLGQHKIRPATHSLTLTLDPSNDHSQHFFLSSFFFPPLVLAKIFLRTRARLRGEITFLFFFLFFWFVFRCSLRFWTLSEQAMRRVT